MSLERTSVNVGVLSLKFGSLEFAEGSSWYSHLLLSACLSSDQ